MKMYAPALNATVAETNHEVRETDLALTEHDSQRLEHDAIRRLAAIGWMLVVDALPGREHKPVDVTFGHHGINSGKAPALYPTLAGLSDECDPAPRRIPAWIGHFTALSARRATAR
jgi:hypothetical protein